MSAVESLLDRDLSLTPQEPQTRMTGRMALSYFCSITVQQAGPQMLVMATAENPVTGRLLVRIRPDI